MWDQDFDYAADIAWENKQEALADEQQERFEYWCDAHGYEYDDQDAIDNYAI